MWMSNGHEVEAWQMDMRQTHCCSTDQESVVYIEDQCSEGSLSSSLVIPTTRQPTESFAEVSILRVPLRRVVATTRTQQEVSAKLESYIYKTCLVHATNNQTCPYVYTSSSYLLQGYHVIYIYPDVIFQVLPPCFGPMMSHHVTCHVTSLSCDMSHDDIIGLEPGGRIQKVTSGHMEYIWWP